MTSNIINNNNNNPENASDTLPIVIEMKDAEIQCRPTVAACFHHTRHVVLIQGVCFLAIIMSSIVCWNPAMIVLIDVKSSPLYNESMNIDEIPIAFWDNPELAIGDRRIPYTTTQKSSLFAAVFVGAIGGIIPMNFLLQKFGTHKSMIAVGVISIVTTAITPLAAVTNFYFLLVIRICQGTTLANPFPVIGSIANTWSSLKESGVFISILTGFIQISAIFTMPVSGVLATNVSWDSVFYVHAAVCAIFCALWGYNFNDEPYRHPFVSDKEFRKISIGKALQKSKKYTPPYKRILTTPAIWGIWIATAGNFLVSQFAITYIPMYLVYVCGIRLSIASVIAAVPLLLQFCFKFVAGMLSDKWTRFGNLCKIRCFNSIAFFGCGITLIICAVLSQISTILDTILIIIAISFLGFNAGGFTKSTVLVSKQYSPTVMAFMQCIMCLALFGGSYLVPSLTPENTAPQYCIVFYIYAAVLIVTNIVFCILAQGKPAEWTNTDNINDTSTDSSIATIENGNNKHISNLQITVSTSTSDINELILVDHTHHHNSNNRNKKLSTSTTTSNNGANDNQYRHPQVVFTIPTSAIKSIEQIDDV